MKKKKRKKIKNKIKSREPSLEQQREEISSTFGWYFSGQVLLKASGMWPAGSGLSCAGTLGGCLLWGHGHRQVLLQGWVGVLQAEAAVGLQGGRTSDCLSPAVRAASLSTAASWAGELCQLGARLPPCSRSVPPGHAGAEDEAGAEEAAVGRRPLSGEAQSQGRGPCSGSGTHAPAQLPGCSARLAELGNGSWGTNSIFVPRVAGKPGIHGASQRSVCEVPLWQPGGKSM